MAIEADPYYWGFRVLRWGAEGSLVLAVRGLNLRLIIGGVLYVLAILGLRTCTVTLCTACQPWCIRWCDRGPSNHSGDHSGTGSCVSCVQRSSRLYISRRVDTRPCSDFSVSILDLVDSFRLDHAHCVHPIIHIPGKGGGGEENPLQIRPASAG